MLKEAERVRRPKRRTEREGLTEAGADGGEAGEEDGECVCRAADTACDATQCAASKVVVSNACTACSVGKTNVKDDDASDSDTGL